jgi:COP9 signalosome complex subunit 6
MLRDLITVIVQLVLINISDHCMRIRSQDQDGYPRVIGCLLGQHNGRCVDISNSFEMVETGTPENPDFIESVFAAKQTQYAECFKSLHAIGWYATDTLQPSDLHLHKRFIEVTEIQAPVFLLLDPKGAMEPGMKELPVELYESGTSDLLA